MKAFIELSKAFGILALVLIVAFLIGTVGVMGFRYLVSESQPIAYENFYTMRIIYVDDVESTGPSEQEIRNMELQCKGDYDMAHYIQLTRIISGDDWETFKRTVEEGYHPGQPLGAATTPNEIAIKDLFWMQTLVYAEFIYKHIDRGWAPEVVGNVFLDACLVRETTRLNDKYGYEEPQPQKYDV